MARNAHNYQGASSGCAFSFFLAQSVSVKTSPAIPLMFPENYFCVSFATPFGAMGVRTEAGQISACLYLPEAVFKRQQVAAKNELAERAMQQLLAYCADPDFVFDLPLKPAGTTFQQRVWQAIAAIPRGQVLTYGVVAKGLRSAPRAVGQACGANPYPLIIPCHRVTAAQGLGGFAHSDDQQGYFLQVKRWLLQHEQVPAYSQAQELLW